jgi:hypothetical protein
MVYALSRIPGHKKMANRTSHRYNRLPLLPSDPGGVQQELVVPACRGAKIEDIWNLQFLIIDFSTPY